MADDWTGYDAWKTTPPSFTEERMTFVLCKHGHSRLTRDPDSPCPQCQEAA